MNPLPSLPAAAASTPNGPVLRDIHLPGAPSWWPPAPGWWVLAGLLLIGLLLLAWRHRRHRQRERELARVLAELDDAVSAYRGDHDAGLALSRMHQLLRRAARRIDPAAARLQGEAWQQLLARVPLPDEALRTLQGLEQVMYRRAQADQVDASATALRQWLQQLWRRRLRPGRPA